MTTQQHLTQLESTGLLRLAQTHPELEYLFRHALVQDAAYESLLLADRQKLHRQVGETIERLFPDRLEELASLLGQHFAKAGETEMAITYLLQAGDRARGLYAHPEAIGFYRQALTLLRKAGDNERTAAVLMKLGLTYHNAFDFEQSRLAYEEAFTLQKTAAYTPSTLSLSPSSHTLRVALTQDHTLPLPDPKNVTTVDVSTLISLLFSGLVEPGTDMEVTPGIAHRWEILDQGQRYRFYLRDDVNWSDGTPVTAADFAFAWKRILDPTLNSASASMLYDIKGARDFHQGKFPHSDQIGVRALDDVTLEVTLEGPAGYFLQLLTDPVTFPVPQHIVSVYGERWATPENIVTNGPFKLESWQDHQKILLARNPTYYGQFNGNVNWIELNLAVCDEEIKLAAYQADELDAAIFWVPPPAMDAFKQHHPDQFFSRPQQFTSHVTFTAVDRPPFDDVRVRQAFALAVDRERLANEVMGGHHTPATGGFIPPGMWGHSAGLALPYDPNQARQLLTEAGYPNGAGFPTTAIFLSTAKEPVGRFLQQQWQENLGINVMLEVKPMSAILNPDAGEVAPLILSGWNADYTDPDNFLRVALSTAPGFKWRNDTFEQLVQRARRSTDHQMRVELYRQADRILVAEETAVLPLTHAQRAWLVKPRIKEFPMPPLNELWGPQDIIIDPSRHPTSLPPASTHILRVPSSTIPTLDPTRSTDDPSGHIIFQLFSGLVAEGSEGMVAPDVARQWEISNDGQRYVFHLREDVFWSDGVRVTAADFVFAWQRALTPETNASANMLYDINGAEDFHRGYTTDPNTIGVYAPDELTLVVELKQPASYFLQLLTDRIAYPVPRHVIASCGEQWTEAGKMVSNGPFKLEAGRIDEKLTLVRNPAYHGTVAGNVQQIDISIFLNWSPVPDLYDTDRLDIIHMGGDLPRAVWEDFRQRYRQDYFYYRPSLSSRAVYFNLHISPFDDVRVRQALAMAVDTEQLLGVSVGQVIPATGGFVPSGMPGHSGGIGLAFNPDRARHLLTEAGYPDGRGFPAITWLTNLSQIAICQNLVQQWQENLGINLQWEGVAWSEYYVTVERVQPHLFMRGWVADYPDPDNFLRVAISPRSRWPNKTYIELVEQARTLLDHTERMKLYAKADRLLVEQAVIIPLYYYRGYLLAKPWLKNVRFSATDNPFWKDVIIEPH